MVDTQGPIPEPQMSWGDPNVARVVARHIARSEAGMRKYGTTTARGDLSAHEWIQHAQDEVMDASVYLERLKSALPVMIYRPWAFVRAFHEKFELRTDRADWEMHSRISLLEEELKELKDALWELAMAPAGNGQQKVRAMQHILKEWGDMEFVLWGTAVEFGFDNVAPEAFRRVAEANMTKDGDQINNKLTKEPGYREPNMDGLWIP